MNNLLVTMLDKGGVPTENWATAPAKLEHLSDI